MSENVEDMIFTHRCIIRKPDTLTIAVYRRRCARIWKVSWIIRIVALIA